MSTDLNEAIGELHDEWFFRTFEGGAPWLRIELESEFRCRYPHLATAIQKVLEKWGERHE